MIHQLFTKHLPVNNIQRILENQLMAKPQQMDAKCSSRLMSTVAEHLTITELVQVFIGLQAIRGSVK